MTRQRNHTVEKRFSIRIEDRLNQALTTWAKEEGTSKTLLIEQILGQAVRARLKEKDSKAIITSETN